jgi:hypothetical protein
MGLVYRVYRVSWSGLELYEASYDTHEEALKYVNHEDNKDVRFRICLEHLN